MNTCVPVQMTIRKIFLGCLAVMSVTAMSGCSSFYNPFNIVSPKNPMDYAYEDKDQMRDRIREDLKWIRDNETRYYASTDEAERRRIRNEVVSRYLTHVNEFWRLYRSNFYETVAGARTGFESTSGLLSGAAAITTPPHASQLLAAISSGTSLVGTSIQKNYLQENAADLLLSQMEADRKTISVKIQLGLAKSTDEYSLAQAHADVDEYAFSLSIPSALASLRAASGASLQAAKNMANEPVKAEAEKNIAVQQGEKAKAEAEAAVQQTAKTEAETKAAVVGAEKTKAETKAAVLETEKAKAETAAAAQQAEKARAQADKAEAELRKKEIEAKKSEI